MMWARRDAMQNSGSKTVITGPSLPLADVKP